MTFVSEGNCIYCNKVYKRAGISRHLNTHLKKMEPQQKKQAYHLRIDANPYFLNLLADENTTLGELDHFLRAIWLECCGHFDKGLALWYAYDFGSTTELSIQCLDVYPIATKKHIDILSRNNPTREKCATCKEIRLHTFALARIITMTENYLRSAKIAAMYMRKNVKNLICSAFQIHHAWAFVAMKAVQ